MTDIPYIRNYPRTSYQKVVSLFKDSGFESPEGRNAREYIKGNEKITLSVKPDSVLIVGEGLDEGLIKKLDAIKKIGRI